MRTRPAAALGATDAGRATDPHRAGDDAARSAVGVTPATKAAMVIDGGWGGGRGALPRGRKKKSECRDTGERRATHGRRLCSKTVGCGEDAGWRAGARRGTRVVDASRTTAAGRLVRAAGTVTSWGQPMAAASRPSRGAWGWHGEAALRLPIEIAATRCSWASEGVVEWEKLAAARSDRRGHTQYVLLRCAFKNVI